MPTFTGKKFSSYYKNLLGINQATNAGTDSTTRAVQDGAGNSTAISLSDDQLRVSPINDNTTGTMLVKNNDGDNILAVDTTNSKVLIGASQIPANINYVYFGVNASDSASLTANTHYPLPFQASAYSAAVLTTDFGTGTDPDDSFTTANTATQYASQIVPMIWLLPLNITISSVTSIEGADNASGDTTRMHLKSFDFTSGSTSCLANGTLLAHNSDVTNAGNEQAYRSTWTIDSANVDADQAILCFFRSDSVNSDYSITVNINYFVR